MRIVIITGLSGSGKSTAVHALEDEGFFCLDNLPVTLFPTFVDLVEKSKEGIQDVALVIDIRGRDFIRGYEQVLTDIESAGHTVTIIFFDASDEVLIRRFSETRRRHPVQEFGSLPEAIRFERIQLAQLRQMSSLVIDTSELTVHQLRDKFVATIRGKTDPREMAIHIQSFGFRFGIPLESDLLLDVRFLPNPYFVPELKAFTGLEPRVQAFVLQAEECKEFLIRLKALLECVIPGYRRERKSYLTISIGCTGGRHRSVAIAEEIHHYLCSLNLRPRVTHRDMEKG